jgi:uncharacterized membrane protein SirB2
MKKTAAIFWGILTVAPLAYFPYFMGFMDEFGATQNAQHAQAKFNAILPTHVSVVLFVIALLVSYVVYLSKTEFVRKDKKATWLVVLILGGVFAMPIFWFLHVWQPLSNEGRN